MNGKQPPDYSFCRVLLDNARLHFKLVFGLTAIHPRPQPAYLDTFSFGRHVAHREELELATDEEERAFASLEHCATYICAIQTHTVLESIYCDPFRIAEPDVADAFQIARLIRNAFAHNPFAPEWQFSSTWANRVFQVPGVITLDTNNLNGRPVNRMHYGGPLAILRLMDFTAKLVERKSREGA